MTNHRHLQLDMGMMAKRVKLLAIYDAIPLGCGKNGSSTPMKPSQHLEQSMGTVIRLHLLSFGVVKSFA